MEKSTTEHRAAHEALGVVLQVREEQLQALLWLRARQPFLGAWSLPGGRLGPDETLEDSIRRHLAAKVDVRELSHLEQIETLSDPGRYPGERLVATAYLGLIPAGTDPQVPADTTWHPVDDLPELAFDHLAVVLAGRERLRAKLSYTNIGLRVLLRRRLLEPIGELRPPGRAGGRPAAVYRFRTRNLEVTDQFAVLKPPR
jgi:ADP-ribose pyrophosphatase YjhB (NUDIX family)